MSVLEIRRFAKPGPGSVNSFAIVTEKVVVLIDGQRELSTAREALAALNPGGSPIAAIFLTHAHPDHFGGIGVFADTASGAPLYASAATRAAIAEDRGGYIAKSRQVVGDDLPTRPTLPDHVISGNETVTAGDLRFETREMGSGEADAMTVLYLPESGDLFAGDIVQHQMTAFLLEGRIDAWLAQLDRLKELYPDARTLHPGHGESGPAGDLIAWQRGYLTQFRELVYAEMQGGTVDAEGERRVLAEIRGSYPALEPVAMIPDLLEQDIKAVAGALAD